MHSFKPLTFAKDIYITPYCHRNRVSERLLTFWIIVAIILDYSWLLLDYYCNRYNNGNPGLPMAFLYRCLTVIWEFSSTLWTERVHLLLMVKIFILLSTQLLPGNSNILQFQPHFCVDNTVLNRTVRCLHSNKSWTTSDLKELLNRKQRASSKGDLEQLGSKNIKSS